MAWQSETQAGSVRSNRGLFHKTKSCRFFMQSVCTNGDACIFAHGEKELQPLPDFFRTRPCKTLALTGKCTQPHCRYAHSSQELRPLDDFLPSPAQAESMMSPSPAATSSRFGFGGNTPPSGVAAHGQALAPPTSSGSHASSSAGRPNSSGSPLIPPPPVPPVLSVRGVTDRLQTAPYADNTGGAVGGNSASEALSAVPSGDLGELLIVSKVSSEMRRFIDSLDIDEAKKEQLSGLFPSRAPVPPGQCVPKVSINQEDSVRPESPLALAFAANGGNRLTVKNTFIDLPSEPSVSGLRQVHTLGSLPLFDSGVSEIAQRSSRPETYAQLNAGPSRHSGSPSPSYVATRDSLPSYEERASVQEEIQLPSMRLRHGYTHTLESLPDNDSLSSANTQEDNYDNQMLAGANSLSNHQGGTSVNTDQLLRSALAAEVLGDVGRR